MAEVEPVSFEDRLLSLKEQYGEQIAVDEISSVVGSLLQGTPHDTKSQDLYKEVRDMLSTIETAKNELSSMRPNSLSIIDIPQATDELSAVVKSTEGAASVIMDSADTLSEMAFSMEGENAETLMTLSTKLFEASSFQDLTGQRINKVTSTLEHLEERLGALAEAIGDTYIEEVEEAEFDETGNVVNDEALLHGPQMDGEGNSQADIDALLASFD